MWSGRWPTISAPRESDGHDQLPQTGRGLERQAAQGYFTENTPEPIHDPAITPGRQLDPGGRLTAYYTGRDSRAMWRPDMPLAAAQALGINPCHQRSEFVSKPPV